MPNRLDELRPFYDWAAAKWLHDGTVSCVVPMLGDKFRLRTECDESGSSNEY